MIGKCIGRALGGGTAVSLFGILFAQTKSFNHIPDLVIWLIATFLLIASLWIALKKSKAEPFAVAWAAAAAGELLLCVFVLVDVLRHLHSL